MKVGRRCNYLKLWGKGRGRQDRFWVWERMGKWGVLCGDETET